MLCDKGTKAISRCCEQFYGLNKILILLVAVVLLLLV